MPTTCPAGKVLNPATGRCVKETKPKSCPEGKVLKVATGRCIIDKKSKDAKNMPDPGTKSKKAKRLPKLWEFEYTVGEEALFQVGLKYMKTIKSQLQPGDIVFPEGGLREDGIIIVGKRCAAVLPLFDKDGNKFLPAWALEMGVKNGYNLQQLSRIYEEGPFNYLILPKHFTERFYPDELLIKNGVVKKLLAHWVDYGEFKGVNVDFAVEKVYL